MVKLIFQCTQKLALRHLFKYLTVLYDKTLADSSDSKIAEMTIKGNNMGITKGLKHLHDYEGNDRQVRSLAEKLLSTEQANVEQMKPFL